MTVTESSRVGVLGAGSWGTALAVHVARCGHPTTLWCRTAEHRSALAGSGSNERYLPGISFPETLTVTDALEDLAEHEVVLVVVPSHGFRSVLRDFLSVSRVASPTIVSGTKGIEQDSLARMSNVCFEEGARVGRELRFAVLSGPSFATELAAGDPTACVVASEDAELARSLQDGFSQQNLRLYTSSDVVGVELGGTAKNIVRDCGGVGRRSRIRSQHTRRADDTRAARSDSPGAGLRRTPAYLLGPRRNGRPRAHLHGAAFAEPSDGGGPRPGEVARADQR